MTNITLHQINIIHDVDANSYFNKGNPVHVNYSEIIYVSEQPYPETIETNGVKKVYSEIGLSSGHILTVFEEPEYILELIKTEDERINAETEDYINKKFHIGHSE